MAASLKDPGSIPGGELKGFHNKLQLCVLHWWGAHFMRGRHSFGHGFDLQVLFLPWPRIWLANRFNPCKIYIKIEFKTFKKKLYIYFDSTSWTSSVYLYPMSNMLDLYLRQILNFAKNPHCPSEDSVVRSWLLQCCLARSVVSIWPAKSTRLIKSCWPSIAGHFYLQPKLDCWTFLFAFAAKLDCGLFGNDAWLGFNQL